MSKYGDRHNGGVTKATLERQIRHLAEVLLKTQTEVVDLRIELRHRLTKAELDEILQREGARLALLRDDAVRILRVLVEAGVVAQEVLNQAVERRPGAARP